MFCVIVMHWPWTFGGSLDSISKLIALILSYDYICDTTNVSDTELLWSKNWNNWNCSFLFIVQYLKPNIHGYIQQDQVHQNLIIYLLMDTISKVLKGVRFTTKYKYSVLKINLFRIKFIFFFFKIKTWYCIYFHLS